MSSGRKRWYGPATRAQTEDALAEALTERLKNYGDFDYIGRQHERLEAERQRLKRMRLAGDFDEDIDLYNSEPCVFAGNWMRCRLQISSKD